MELTGVVCEMGDGGGGEKINKRTPGQEKKEKKNRKKRHIRSARLSWPPTLAGAFGTGCCVSQLPL